ncbi:MAG: translation initiation factor [Kofleriaceae bacterium]|nr:translation initiation factor [Kofleriaceae bacterium]
MAKSKKRQKESKKSSQVGTGDSALGHNPFGALSALAGSLPQVPSLASQDSELETDPDSPPRASEFGSKLVVRREVKGRAGKTVTRIAGVSPDALDSVAKRMKKALGCGALVEGSDVVLLGSLVDRASEWLTKAGAGKIVKGN